MYESTGAVEPDGEINVFPNREGRIIAPHRIETILSEY
jgi:hypothetical protein